MPATANEYVHAAQEQTLKSIRETQQAVVEAVRTWASAVEKTIPDIPTNPIASELPSPQTDVRRVARGWNRSRKSASICSNAQPRARRRGVTGMSDSVYRVTEVIGVSPNSWEAAAQNAVQTAARSIRDLRVAEATRFDVTIKDGSVAEYRVRLDISFKYEAGD